MITVTLVDTNTYEVVCSRGAGDVCSRGAGDVCSRGAGDVCSSRAGEVQHETVHRVRMSPQTYQKLCGGAFTHEWLIVQAFQFLLERESNTEILEEFDLSTINRYFPEFEDEIDRRLNRR